MYLKNKSQLNPFSLSREEIQLLDGFKKWLDKNTPSKKFFEELHNQDLTIRWAALHRWQRQLADSNWMCVSLPVEYGGRGASLVSEHLIGEELGCRSLPYCANWPSVAAAVPALLAFGSEKQKKEYLPRIVTGEDVWCISVTEPNQGTDIMRTETAAIEKDDCFILNGTKTWSTHSPWATRSLLLARTDASAKSEFAMTMFVVDLKSPGVKIKPLRQTSNDENFGEMVFENVRIPKENIVGTLNSGWMVQTCTWLAESHPAWDVANRVGPKFIKDFKKFKKNKKSLFHESEVVEKIIDAEMVRLMAFQVLRDDSSSDTLRMNSPLVKIAYTEALQKLAPLGMDLKIEESQLSWESKTSSWTYQQMLARCETIARSPTELHHNFLASFFLGLPYKDKK